jgi:hypothetical protein
MENVVNWIALDHAHFILRHIQTSDVQI